MDKKKDIPISIILLAGGKSTRIGINKDKIKMKLLGMTLIDYVISNIILVNGVSKKDIIIVGPKEKYIGYEMVVEDVYPHKGPLGGIFSGLKASNTFYNLVIGSDMPFVENMLVEYMIENSVNYDLVIPRYGNGLIEPLCAIYGKNCLKIIEKNIKNRKLTIRHIFPFLKIRWIEENEIKRFDPEMNSFFNINFKTDFFKAEMLSRKRSENSC